MWCSDLDPGSLARPHRLNRSSRNAPSIGSLSGGVRGSGACDLTTSNHNTVAAIEEITVREGINPRQFLRLRRRYFATLPR
jgi:hypothetical protein